MRFPIVALYFLIASFIFFVMFGVTSLLLSETLDAMDNYVDDLPAKYDEQINLINSAFGIIASIFFVTGIVLIFVLDSLSDDPDIFYRR